MAANGAVGIVGFGLHSVRRDVVYLYIYLSNRYYIIYVFISLTKYICLCGHD